MSSKVDQINILYSQGKFTEVLKVCTELSISPQADPYPSQVLAASLFALGRYREAQPILETLEPAFASHADFLSLYAANSRRLGDLSTAYSLFIEALKVDPTNPLIKNNFANLLIDQEKFIEADAILSEVVKGNPEYTDASENLARVRKLISSNQDMLSENTANSAITSFTFDDPLLVAFNQEEVDFSFQRYIAKFKPSKNDSLSDLPPPSKEQVALDQLEAARLALSEKNPLLALKLCSKVVSILSHNPLVYEYASDAYLEFQDFRQAEICLAHSIILGGCSLKHFFNMISFARMRKDFYLARCYLRKACLVDPTSPEVVKLKTVLESELSGCNETLVFEKNWPAPKF